MFRAGWLRQPIYRPAGKICDPRSIIHSQELQIFRFLLGTAIAKPRLTIAAALLALVALAATMSYTGFLVIGVLADYLGISRFIAGLLLGALFARFPRISNGKLGMVGLLPKPVRQPLIAGLLALCLLRFLAQGDVVAALCTGLTMAFVMGFSWLRKTLFARLSSSVSNFAGGRNTKAPAAGGAAGPTDHTVIDGEFRELKD